MTLSGIFMKNEGFGRLTLGRGLDKPRKVPPNLREGNLPFPNTQNRCPDNPKHQASNGRQEGNRRHRAKQSMANDRTITGRSAQKKREKRNTIGEQEEGRSNRSINGASCRRGKIREQAATQDKTGATITNSARGQPNCSRSICWEIADHPQLSSKLTASHGFQ